jgi:hypothetical protein
VVPVRRVARQRLDQHLLLQQLLIRLAALLDELHDALRFAAAGAADRLDRFVIDRLAF